MDSSGNETINAGDCHFGLVGTTTDGGLGDPTDGYDILGNTQANTNPCGFANPPAAANNGLVDRNSDGNITAADSCSTRCFFRHNVSFGVVQAAIGQPFPAPPAGAFTGGFSPMIVSGRADLNGNGVVTGGDDANAFYGDTNIIDGFLDCDAWSGANDGAAGDGVITSADNCTLVGYDGTANGVTIDVIDGEFQVANGLLPTVFNAADPDNPDIGDSDFAWSAIRGRVDSNGNESSTPRTATSESSARLTSSEALRRVGLRPRLPSQTTGSSTVTATGSSRRPTRVPTAASSATTFGTAS